MKKKWSMSLVVGAVVLVSGGAAALVASEQSAEAAFPGQNGRIAFVSDPRNEVPRQIRSVKPNGSGKATVAEGRFVLSPSYSADGQRIAWHDRLCINTVGQRECDRVFVANADGSDPTPIRFGPDDLQPAWFPSGNRLIVSSRSPNGHEFHLHAITFDEEGTVTESTQLTNEGDASKAPAVSPDGEKVAFVRFFRDNRGDPSSGAIYVLNTGSPEGPSNPAVRITGGRSPDWSPDGSSIAFARGYTTNGFTNPDIFVARADGTHQRRLTTDPLDEIEPAWSPDSKKIAYVRFTGNGPTEVWKMRANGTSQIRVLVDNRRTLQTPSWQPIP